MVKNNPAFNLQEITTQKAKELPLGSRVAVFPIGSNEQHGPHLPTGTDTMILESVVDGARQKLNQDDPFIFMPLMPYGKSPEHMSFAGTISLKATTLIAVLEDIVFSLQAHGVQKIVFLNSHGGNTYLLNAISHDLRYTHKVHIYCLNLWSEDFLSAREIEEIMPELDYPEIHAASVETSLLLFLKPDLVAAIPQGFKPKAPFSSIVTGWMTTDYSDNGVIGDLRQSGAAKGKLFYDLLVEKTVSKLKEIARI